MKMLEPRNVAEKKFNAETHRIIGEVQLQEYGLFLYKYNSDLLSLKEKLSTNASIRINPIFLENTATEDVSVLQLVHTDHKLLSRILASLASVCEEITRLVTEAKEFYITFIYYGEDCGKGLENLETISTTVEKLHKVVCFVHRSRQLIVLLLKQLCAILGKKYYSGNHSSSFPEPLDCLAELLVCLLTLDAILTLPTLKEHWALYRRTIRNMLHNPSHFNFDRDKLRCLDKALSDIEASILSGHILRHTYLNQTLMTMLKNQSLCNEFINYINHLLVELEKDDDSLLFTHIWLQTNALVVFEYNVFGNVDKKILKKILDINKKASACTLVGNITWYPEQFLLKHIQILSKTIDVKAMESYRLSLINSRCQNLPKETHSLCLQACLWMIEIVKISKKDVSTFDAKALQDAGNLLIDGVKLVKKISEFVKWIINLHADKGKPMTKSVLLLLCRLIEVLKALQFIFDKNLLPIVYVIQLLSQQLTHKALMLLHNIKKSFTQEKSYKEQHLDVLSALTVCEQTLKGPNTSQRILVAKLALSASGLHDNLFEIRAVITRLELVCYIHSLMKQLCDCSFLYWHQIRVLPFYFSKLVDTKSDMSKYYLILSALSDCALISGDKVSEMTEIFLKEDLLSPLNQIVETNLRLQTHLHLHLPPSDPFKEYFPPNFKKYLPARVHKQYFSLKKEAEYYLSTMFYNLTTVVLHDWRTYGEMRRLAYLQYNLETVEDHLPMQTLEQGLDVLEIMRNINVFVGKYLYNLNNQIFIEESNSNSKILNTINISHVANSIRTHGLGIMNTAVNFTYQFLQNKFYIFSQFMFDEHIKSRLLKDLRFFSEHRAEFSQMYPYDRAEKFNFGIRKLGLNASGLSYLDLFRKLITHIGNAMGYVRLIRSGGRRSLADGTCFIPDLKGVQDACEILNNEEMPELTKRASDCFKSDVKNIVENFEEASEYFKLLVNVFAPVFRNTKNIHLRNFYIIVPPLTINFIEHSLNCKERLNKKNKTDAAFTDDGFAIGLAYIIELLEQSNQLKSLQWFQSVKAKFTQGRRAILQQKTIASKEDEKLQQTLTLSEKRISAFEKEFDLLYYNFSSARIFFQC